MNTKYVYPAVLLIVLSAWFGHSTVKPSTSASAQDKKSVSLLDEDAASLGIESGELVIGGKCNLEYINETMMNASVNSVSKDGDIKFTGWAMDVEKLRLPMKIIVRFTDELNKDFYEVARTGFARPDVKDYFDLPEVIIESGFELVTNFRDYPLGQYSLTLIVFYDDVAYLCDSGRKINIR